MGIFERPPKSGVWWISYCDGGGARHREKVGRRDQAHMSYAQRRLEIAEGVYVPPRARTLSFRELAATAMESKKLRVAPRSFQTDQLRLGKLFRVNSKLPSMPAEGVGSEVLEALFDNLRRIGLCGGTVNRYRSLLSSIFAYGVRSGQL